MRFKIEVEVERVTGKFAGRDEIEEILVSAIEEADLYGVGADGESEYEIVSVESAVKA